MHPPSWARAPVQFGTSSFSAKDWVGPFYPPGTRSGDYLRHYAQRLGTVEIDATYYAVPSPRTVAGWAAKTPESFLIAAKFPRDIVHGGQGPRPDPARILDPDHSYPVRDAFLEVMTGLGPRLGPLLIQFPFLNRGAFGSAGPFMDRLDRFLDDLPKDFCYAVEIRNQDWLNAEFAALCRRHDVALVLSDQAWMPHADEIDFDPITTGFSYVRLLGDHREIEKITTTWDREVVDRTDRLRRWSRVLVRLLEREVPTLVFVNNHYAGHAPATLERLREMFREAASRNGLEPGNG